MKPTHWLLFFISCFIGLIVLSFLTEAPIASTGTIHPDHPSMLKSGSSVLSSPTSKWLSAAFGLNICLILISFIFIGAQKKHPQPKLQKWLLVVGGGYLLVYILSVAAYWTSATESTPSYFGSFPLPTAWVIYGMWFFPAFFSIIYVRRFSHWILTEEEEQRFAEIVRKRQASTSE